MKDANFAPCAASANGRSETEAMAKEEGRAMGEEGGLTREKTGRRGKERLAGEEGGSPEGGEVYQRGARRRQGQRGRGQPEREARWRAGHVFCTSP